MDIAISDCEIITDKDQLVRILNCSGKEDWYKYNIGSVFDVKDCGKIFLVLNGDATTILHIMKCEC